MSPPIVHVDAPSRLHFGMLSFGQPGVRQFGGAGVMISQPELRLTIAPAERFAVEGQLTDRVSTFMERLARHTHWCPREPRCRILIETVPPQHAGLGSGTQLGMALALGMSRFFGAPVQSTAELAHAVGRGRRSAVGAHGAVGGGLLVESGKLSDDELGPLVCRIELPETWRFVLAMPPGETGLSGETEQQAFAVLPPVPTGTTAALCRELIAELLPAATVGDFDRFGESLYRYGRLAGGCFMARQGGVYASVAVKELVERCRASGVRGVGQSSWGPTVYALCASQSSAEALVERLRASSGGTPTTMIAAPDNRGCRISTTDGAG